MAHDPNDAPGTPRRRAFPPWRRLLDVPRLARSPAGRWTLRHHALFYLWPVLAPAARLYRRTALAGVPLVAVVGSLGKSTTAACVSAALGLPPEPRPELNGWSWVALAALRTRPRQEARVIEVGLDGPGQMARHARTLRPDVAVVTAVTGEHNRSLPSLEVTRTEKAEMVTGLRPGGVAVLNGDDANVRWMATRTTARAVFFGLRPDNDVRALDVEDDWPRGTSFTLRCPSGERRGVRTRLVGTPAVYASLAAVAVALELGRDLDGALARLATLAPVDGRMCPVALPSGALLLCDDKNSSEASVRSSLDALALIPAARKLVVLGEVFEPRGKAGPLHRSIGERMGRVADRALLMTGRNRASALRAGARAAGMPPADVRVVGPDVRRATEVLRDELRLGDVVLIKGRGTEHLERIALGLLGRPVRCTLPLCKVPEMRCGRCPQLEVGPPP